MKKQGLDATSTCRTPTTRTSSRRTATFFEGPTSSPVLHPVRGEDQARGPQGLREVDEKARRHATTSSAWPAGSTPTFRHRPRGGRPRLHPAEGHRRASTRSPTTPPRAPARARLDHRAHRRRGPAAATSRSKSTTASSCRVFGEPGKPFVCFETGAAKVPEESRGHRQL